MHWWTWLALAAGVLTLTLLAVALSIRRSRTALLEFVKLVPPCLALLRDIMRDPQVPRRAKVAPALAIVYLMIPIDLIPDFIPGIGHLDDALIVGWAIRHVVSRAGRERVEHHWRGDPDTLARILRIARVR